MKTRFLLTPALVTALLTCGCWETKDVTTLNPDGSGKLAFDVITIVPPDLNPFGGGAQQGIDDPDEAARKAITKMIHKDAKGVEAWSDLSYAVRKDGRIRLKGVAYFADYGSLKLPWFHMRAQWKRVEGGMVLEAVVEAGKQGLPGETAPGPAKPGPMTPEQVAKKLLAARMQYQQGRVFMVVMLDALTADVNFRLPGKLAERGAADKLVADDAFMTEVVKTAQDPMKSELGRKRLSKLLFGSETGLRAKVTGELKPLFDYRAEVDKAKEAMPGMFESLKIQPPAAPVPVS